MLDKVDFFSNCFDVCSNCCLNDTTWDQLESEGQLSGDGDRRIDFSSHLLLVFDFKWT